jgi:phosphomannomutase
MPAKRFRSESLTAVYGSFHPRALGLVLEWWSLHQHELADNWKLVNDGEEPRKIEPLE